jgi:hypothetical protein
MMTKAETLAALKLLQEAWNEIDRLLDAHIAACVAYHALHDPH